MQQLQFTDKYKSRDGLLKISYRHWVGPLHLRSGPADGLRRGRRTVWNRHFEGLFISVVRVLWRLFNVERGVQRGASVERLWVQRGAVSPWSASEFSVVQWVRGAPLSSAWCSEERGASLERLLKQKRCARSYLYRFLWGHLLTVSDVKASAHFSIGFWIELKLIVLY